MNKKGFTLIEILVVIILLSIVVIITVPIIGNVSESVKKKTLQTKIDNIESAAILYGQDKENRKNFITKNTDCEYCLDDENTTCEEIDKKEGKCYIGNCNCYNRKINVETLIEDGRLEDDKSDQEGVIVNPLDETQTLNGCEIQMYQKYGKIYAVYDKEYNKSSCWYE